MTTNQHILLTPKFKKTIKLEFQYVLVINIISTGSIFFLHWASLFSVIQPRFFVIFKNYLKKSSFLQVGRGGCRITYPAGHKSQLNNFVMRSPSNDYRVLCYTSIFLITLTFSFNRRNFFHVSHVSYRVLKYFKLNLFAV